MLVDKGLLDYDQLVIAYWPEFGNHGKAHLRLKDVLRHEAGLHRCNGTFTAEHF